MKKSILMSAASLLTIAVACDNGQGGQTKQLRPDEQKVKLEEVGKKLLAQYSADHFTEVLDLAEHVMYTYFESDYDNSVFFDKIEEYGDNIIEFQREEVKDRDQYSKDNISYYLLTASLSKCTGKFDFTDNGVVWSEADRTEITFEDEKGTDCAILLAGSGKETDVRIDNLKVYDHSDGLASPDGGQVNTVYYNVYDATVSVPENLEVTVTRGGSELARIGLTFKFNVREGQPVNLSKDGAEISAKVTIGEYIISVDKVSYESGRAEAKYAMTKGGNPVVTMEASGDVALKNEPADFEFGHARDLAATMDILGEVQLKATFADVDKFMNALDRFYENENESELEYMNDMFEGNVYYDGGSNVQAEFKLIAGYEKEPGYDGNGDGIVDSEPDEYIYIVPAFVFPDGSSYSFESFFDEDDFRSLIDMFERFCDDFAYRFEN